MGGGEQGRTGPAPRALAPGELPPSGRVGRYQLCYRLARGGMGAVYLARMEGPGRFAKLLALKLIHPHLVDQAEVVEMFLEEARLQSRINHPNVCSVTDFGQHEDNYFMAMEFLAGETLEDLVKAVQKSEAIREGALWTSIAVRIVLDACEGLHAAHELPGDHGEPLGLVHRDVSPANIFVTFAGATKVMDFGVATSRDAETKTMPGVSAKGRYHYMSPERARAQPSDRRVDVWSLGVILWELLAQRPLYEQREPAHILMAIVHEEVPSLRSVRPGLPEALDAIIQKALAKDPRDRYATAREMGRDLHRVLSHLPETAGPAEIAETMEALFEDRIRERNQIMEHARQLDSGTVMTLPEISDLHAASTVVEALEGPRTIVAPMTPDGSGIREALSRPPVVRLDDPTAPIAATGADAEDTEDAPSGSRWSVALAVVLAVVAAGLGVVFGLRYFDEAEPGTAATAPSADDERAGVAPPEVARAGSPTDDAPDEADSVQGPAADDTAADDTATDDTATDDTATDDTATDDTAADDTAPSDDAVEGEADEGTTTVAIEPIAIGPIEGDDGEEPEGARTGRRRVRAPSGPPGTVNVVTPGGWADIFVRNRRVGRSPGTLELPPGRHVLVLRPFGTGSPERHVVRVESGQRSHVSVRVQR